MRVARRRGSAARPGGRGRATTRHACVAPGRLGSIRTRRSGVAWRDDPRLAASACGWTRRLRLAVSVERRDIEKVGAVIGPYVRVTPVVGVSGADFGLASFPLALKLELLQHSGSFKARGAFANLLLRKIPAAGVVAASGGNHGAAVAYAAMRLGVRARIFVPTVSSPAKIQRIRAYGADLVVTGDR